MDEANELLRKVAEKMIAESYDDSNHECESPEDECYGCDSMRHGLAILYYLGDPTVYKV